MNPTAIEAKALVGEFVEQAMRTLGVRQPVEVDANLSIDRSVLAARIRGLVRNFA